MKLQAHATEIEKGDYVAYDSDSGMRRHIEALGILRDIGCVHVWTWDRAITFRNTYPVEIAR